MICAVNLNPVIQKYLRNQAAESTDWLCDFPERRYHHGLLIPVYREDPAFLQRLNVYQAANGEPVVIVLVSNHPDNLDSEALYEAQDLHQQLLTQLPPATWRADHLSLHSADQDGASSVDWLLVNLTGIRALPARQAVGAARKIGADLLLRLFASGKLQNHWIFSSDADVKLPPGYFSAVHAVPSNTAAACYPFVHRSFPDQPCSDEIQIWRATVLYEYSLRHYVEGLKRAGSAFAFHSLGSCLAIDCYCYAACRGFPRRAAAEDFYLLNKAAKLGDVVEAQSTPIEIRARLSNRVPIGTGPAVSRLLSADKMDEVKMFHHPEVFAKLRHLLIELRERQPQFLHELELDPISLNALTELGMENAFAHARRQSLNPVNYDRHLRNWFDGFKTLKFIHRLQQTYPKLSIQELESTQ